MLLVSQKVIEIMRNSYSYIFALVFFGGFLNAAETDADYTLSFYRLAAPDEDLAEFQPGLNDILQGRSKTDHSNLLQNLLSRESVQVIDFHQVRIEEGGEVIIDQLNTIRFGNAFAANGAPIKWKERDIGVHFSARMRPGDRRNHTIVIDYANTQVKSWFLANENGALIPLFQIHKFSHSIAISLDEVILVGSTTESESEPENEGGTGGLTELKFLKLVENSRIEASGTSHPASTPVPTDRATGTPGGYPISDDLKLVNRADHDRDIFWIVQLSSGRIFRGQIGKKIDRIKVLRKFREEDTYFVLCRYDGVLMAVDHKIPSKSDRSRVSILKRVEFFVDGEKEPDSSNLHLITEADIGTIYDEGYITSIARRALIELERFEDFDARVVALGDGSVMVFFIFDS